AQPDTHAGEAMPEMAMPPRAAGAPMAHGQLQAAGAMQGMGATHSAHDMHDMRMQGGAAPADARSVDYSGGIGHGDIGGMGMLDAKPLGMLRFDRLEAFHAEHGDGQAWELNGWYGTDTDKLWLRSEGERESGQSGAGDVEALWSRAVAPYWDTQLGVRHDFGDGPSRQWLAFGVQGLAPYWFELEATAYAGPSGRTAARLRAGYELLLTQRLILQPELEANLYGKADPARRIGSGLADASLGLRLRYEFRRQFAPYLGVVWTRRYGGTADFAREEHHPVFDRQFVAGLRIWF
ncbi:MAG TPA: copper resistance protein B, partial [Rhodanobacter sp.]